jgi:hypothetical protein
VETLRSPAPPRGGLGLSARLDTAGARLGWRRRDIFRGRGIMPLDVRDSEAAASYSRRTLFLAIAGDYAC